MTLKLLITPAALADFQAIWDYGAQNWSIGQAESYLAGLRRVFDLLKDQTHIARLRPEFSPPAWIYRYQSHIIVFFADDTSMVIIRVLQGRSNWTAFLEG